jgi:chromosome segregation ATPase
MMSDQNKYINGYIDNAVGMIHENVNLILQLKTQLRLANELISEKDAAIGNLSSELQSNKSYSEEISILNETIKKLENRNTSLQDANNGLSSKVSHMDTLLNQISQMKMDILAKNTQIEQLNEQLNEKLYPKKKIKSINTKKADIVEETTAKTNTVDDF